MTDSKEQETRIEQIFGEDNINVSNHSLELYRLYLQKNIVIPCYLTGIEDFSWEEYYSGN